MTIGTSELIELVTQTTWRDAVVGTGAIPTSATLDSDAPVLCLDGDWRFALWQDEIDAPTDVQSEDFDDSRWSTIRVPSSWPMEGWGAPAYTNIRFPFPIDPLVAPPSNIGDYRRRFDLAELPRRAWLRFDGVDNAARVWLNGVEVGTLRGSRLRSQFDVSSLLRPGANLLVVRVAAFSATSFIEDQDMWWLPGIFRSVTLHTRPVGAIDDITMVADFDHASGRGSLTIDTVVPDGAAATVSIPELGLENVPAGLIQDLHVEPWSDENPRLYEVLVATHGERVTLRAGFRRVEVSDGRLLLNGKPLRFRGVNRHEHDPVRGRAITREDVRADLVLMKRYNINAVRTSHYPPHPALLELADELGLLVVDECDLETHGFSPVQWRANPSDAVEWRAAYLDRARRLVQRDKNHACVVMWSLGNEAGMGANLVAMAEEIRRMDPTRPIHYEGDQDCVAVDIWSQMYTDPEDLLVIGSREEPALADPSADTRRRGLPFMLCEYAHAMGTGPGGLEEYARILDGSDRFAGGFIWEWKEQGIVQEIPGGTRIAYGGDFGEPLHDGNYVIDGLVSAHGEPRPAMLDVKAVYAPVKIELERETATARITNLMSAVTTSAYEFHCVVATSVGIVASQKLDVPSVRPSESYTVHITATLAQLPSDRDAVLTVSARLREHTAWAPAGHEVASAQIVHVAARPPAEAKTRPVIAGQDIILGPARISRRTGLPVMVGLTEIRDARIELWRAPTDNDNARERHSDGSRDRASVASQWQDFGLNRLTTRLISLRVGPTGVITRLRIAPAGLDCAVDATLSWSSDGAGLHLAFASHPVGEWPIPWARVGFSFTVPEDPAGGDVEWFGRGPTEAYPDTGAGSRFGWYSATVVGMTTPHVKPQESGSRADVHQASIPARGSTLRLDSGPFSLTVRPWSTEALASVYHLDELRGDDRTHVVIDFARHGIGSAACGPGVPDPYRLTPHPVSGAVRLSSESR